MKDSLTAIGVDLSEVALDSISDDGIVKDVPILGTMVNLAKTVGSVRDRILLSKIRSFLEATNDITDAQREKFTRKLEEEPKFAKRVQDLLVIFLDRIDSISKAEILGYLFTGLAKGMIHPEVFYRLSYRLDTCYSADIPCLNEFYDKPEGYVCSPPYPVLPGLVDPVDNMGGDDGIQLFAITMEGQRLTELIRHHKKPEKTTEREQAVPPKYNRAGG